MDNNGNKPGHQPGSPQVEPYTKTMAIPVGEVPTAAMMIVHCQSGRTYISWPMLDDNPNHPDIKRCLQLIADAIHFLQVVTPEAKRDSNIVIPRFPIPPFPKKE